MSAFGFRFDWSALSRRLRFSSCSVACDLICALPLSLIAFVFSPTAIGAVLFLNILTVRHVRQIKPFLDEFDSLRPMTYRLTPLFIALPLIVHFAACIWIKLGSGSEAESSDATLTYVRAMSWAFFGYILSKVAGLIARSDAAREHHMDNLYKIETFMKLHHTPIELRSKIRSYYHYMWINKKGYQDKALIEGLPAKIQSELFLHINRPIIERVLFLRDASDEMIGDLIATLGQGVRSATARASQYCDVFMLHQDAFERVTSKYPEFREHLHDVIR